MNSKEIFPNFLSNKIYDEAVIGIIESNLKKSIDNFVITCSAGSSKGDNFIGVIYRIRVLERDSSEVKLNLIAKLSPNNETIRSEILIEEFFNHEADFYENLVPLLKSFQMERGINFEKEGFFEFPLCYRILKEPPNEGLFFADLKANGFELLHRLKIASKDHVLLVMKVLGKMHATFFAIKTHHPPLIQKYRGVTDPFVSLFEKKQEAMTKYCDELRAKLFAAVYKSENKEMIERVEKLMENSMHELFSNCFHADNFEPFATINHGDCTNNNLLFRYDQNQVPSDVRLLDFQIIRYASPICDVVHYIFVSTSKELRDQHYYEFLDTYYHSLVGFLKRLGTDSKKIFPRNIMDDHLKKFGHFGLLMAIIVLPIFTDDVDDVNDVEKVAEQFKNLNSNGVDKQNMIKINQRYEQRMLGVCEDMFRLGYI